MKNVTTLWRFLRQLAMKRIWLFLGLLNMVLDVTADVGPWVGLIGCLMVIGDGLIIAFGSDIDPFCLYILADEK